MQIKNFKEINKGSLIAKFDIFFDKMGMSIRDCALMQSGSRQWVGMPSRQYQDEHGEKKFYAYVVFSQEKRDSFQHKCLELLRPFLELSPSPSHSEELPF